MSFGPFFLHVRLRGYGFGDLLLPPVTPLVDLGQAGFGGCEPQVESCEPFGEELCDQEAGEDFGFQEGLPFEDVFEWGEVLVCWVDFEMGGEVHCEAWEQVADQ